MMKTTSGSGAERETGGAIAEMTGIETMIGKDGGVTMTGVKTKRSAGVERIRKDDDANATTKTTIVSVRGVMIEIEMAIGVETGAASIGGADLC